MVELDFNKCKALLSNNLVYDLSDAEIYDALNHIEKISDEEYMINLRGANVYFDDLWR